MTFSALGRPKRARPTDRVNYKLDSGVRKLLVQIAERKGRSEGSQVEQLVLFYEACTRLNSEGVSIPLSQIETKVNEIWKEVNELPRLKKDGVVH